MGIEYTLSVEQAMRRLLPACDDVTYRGASLAEKAAVRDLISALWSGDETRATALVAPATTHGLVVERWQVEGCAFVVVREADGARRGAGSYALRAGPAPDAAVLLQAPHSYFDRGTGSIAAHMFFAATGAPSPRLRGLFVNSLHRHQRGPDDMVRDGTSPSDVCHNPDHLFSTATAAALEDAGPLLLSQLHGFGVLGDSDATVDAIVSAGDRHSSTAASSVVAAALGSLGLRALRYPEEVGRLGGTTNAQGRLARRAGVAFVHVEMSADLRARLAADASARTILGRGLIDALAASR